MIAQLKIAAPEHDRRSMQRGLVACRSLVLVASEPSRGRGEDSLRWDRPAEPRRSRPAVVGPYGLRYTRIAAHTVNGSAAWCRAHKIRVSDLPQDLPGILEVMEQAEGWQPYHEAIAATIVALRTADAVVTGPLSADDANAPVLLPHPVDLARRAYRALRPPRELIAQPGFAQVARRFQYIQMSSQQARALGAGATDLGVLAQRLRRLQGDPSEFAITAFSSHGLLWADDAWHEIDPVANRPVDETVAGAVFCTAWIQARRFQGAGAPQALAYARAAAAAVVNR